MNKTKKVKTKKEIKRKLKKTKTNETSKKKV